MPRARKTALPTMVGAMSPPVSVRFVTDHDYRQTATRTIAYLAGMALEVPADHARSAIAAGAAVEASAEG